MKKLFVISFLAVNTLAAQSIRKWYNLAAPLTEISGMTIWQNRYFAHGDGGSAPMIFELDASGKTIDTTTLLKPNTDWEDMAANATHFFVGDFGNNNGTRKDLKILKFPIDSLGKSNIVPEVINFSYADQTDFTSSTFTNYDCEAMVATNDSIYLFSKSKSSGICRVYALPVLPGNYTASITDTIQPPFWVTGAHLGQGQLLLCGYVPNLLFSLTPLISTYNFKDNRVQHGTDKTYSLIYKGTRQVETICLSTKGTILFSGEAYSGDSAAVFELELAAAQNQQIRQKGQGLIPNPARDRLRLNNSRPGSFCGIYSIEGKLLYRQFVNGLGEANIEILPEGTYWVSYLNSSGDRVFDRLIKI